MKTSLRNGNFFFFLLFFQFNLALLSKGEYLSVHTSSCPFLGGGTVWYIFPSLLNLNLCGILLNCWLRLRQWLNREIFQHWSFSNQDDWRTEYGPVLSPSIPTAYEKLQYLWITRLLYMPIFKPNTTYLVLLHQLVQLGSQSYKIMHPIFVLSAASISSH